MIDGQIKCDKCESTYLDNYAKTKPKPPEVVSMTEFARRSKYPDAVHAVYITNIYVLRCRDCGHTVEYQR